MAKSPFREISETGLLPFLKIWDTRQKGETDMLFDILALLSTLIIILLLKRLVNIFPSLVACMIRWKESVNLDASVQLSRDRDIMAIAMVMPFCLTAGKFDFYSPVWTGQFGADGKLGITIGVFIGYILLRKGLEHVFRPKKMNLKTYRTACTSSHTFFIILTLTLMAMGVLENTASRNASSSGMLRSMPAPLPFATTVPEGQPRFRFTS